MSQRNSNRKTGLSNVHKAERDLCLPGLSKYTFKRALAGLRAGMSKVTIMKDVGLTQEQGDQLFKLYGHFAPVTPKATIGSRREPYYKGDFPPKYLFETEELSGEEKEIYDNLQ